MTKLLSFTKEVRFLEHIFRAISTQQSEGALKIFGGAKDVFIMFHNKTLYLKCFYLNFWDFRHVSVFWQFLSVLAVKSFKMLLFKYMWFRGAQPNFPPFGYNPAYIAKQNLVTRDGWSDTQKIVMKIKIKVSSSKMD